jgi:hypothetical protein
MMRSWFYVPSGIELETYSQHIWQRYTGKDVNDLTATVSPEDAERALVHIDSVIDRQIHKSNGILTFNTVFIALLTLEERTKLAQYLPYLNFAELISIILLISSVIILMNLWVHWDKNVANSEHFALEFKRVVRLAAWRSKALMVSIALSIFSALAMTILVFGPELFQSASVTSTSPVARTPDTAPSDEIALLSKLLQGVLDDKSYRATLDGRLNAMDRELSTLEGLKRQQASKPNSEEMPDTRHITEALEKLTDVLEHISLTKNTDNKSPRGQKHP